MSKLRLETAVCSNKGMIRGNNEDNFYLNGAMMPLAHMDEGATKSDDCADALQLYAVFDGMGGESAGELASYEAVSALKSYQGELGTTVDNDSLRLFTERTSDRIYNMAREKGNHSGCTMVLCVWENGVMRTVHVGDSRVYQLRDKQLLQLTDDHSEVQRMVNMGIITREEAKVHPKRNVITQNMGMSSETVRVEATISKPIPCRESDMFLLCSDGLTDMVEDKDICRVLAKASTAKAAAVNLVQLALRNGGKDNVTAMCLRVKKHSMLSGFSAIQKALLGGSAALITGMLLFLAELLFRLL